MSTRRIIDELETRFIWQTMEDMGYLATTPGVRELSNWSLFKELTASSSIQSVSSNLSVVEGGVEKAAGIDYLVTEIGGVEVGFFALIGSNELTTVKKQEGVEFKSVDPVRAASRIVPELREQVEVVVLMSQLSPNETRNLIESVPGIDVALYGRQPSWKQRARTIGSTICQETGLRGQYLGELVLIVDPDGRIVDWGSRNAPLDKKFAENAEVAAAANRVEAEGKELVKEQQRKKTSELENKLSSERFLGVAKCQRCHEAEHKQWASTAHARAFGTLIAEGKEADKNCVGCHVTGADSPSGFISKATSPEMVNVQCEECHGVGTKHGRGKHATPVTIKTCKSCHTGEWGKDFNYSSYMKKVVHSSP
jgi:2',3'-cyclic-nucleotide 2'-phosphodiesterase (5'-nucleotidase family)